MGALSLLPALVGLEQLHDPAAPQNLKLQAGQAAPFLDHFSNLTHGLHVIGDRYTLHLKHNVPTDKEFLVAYLYRDRARPKARMMARGVFGYTLNQKSRFLGHI